MRTGRPRKVLTFTGPEFKTCPAPGCKLRIGVHAVACPRCIERIPKAVRGALESYRDLGLHFTANQGWQLAYDAAMRALQANPPPAGKPWQCIRTPVEGLR